MQAIPRVMVLGLLALGVAAQPGTGQVRIGTARQGTTPSQPEPQPVTSPGAAAQQPEPPQEPPAGAPGEPESPASTPPSTPSPTAEPQARPDAVDEPGSDPVTTSSLAALLDTALGEPQRLEASRALLGRFGIEQGRLAVLGVLRSNSEDATAKWLLVRTLAREPSVPEALLPVLTELARPAEGERLARLLAAIAAARTPDALRFVAGYLEPSHPEPARAAALAALVRATGRDEVGPSPAAWTAWIDHAASPDPTDGLRPTWSAWIVRGLSERMDRLATRSRDLASRLTDAQRRLYVNTDPAQRPALLASLLRDDLPEIRSVGFELLERELAVAPNPGTEVVTTLVALLGHAQAGVRTQAATVIGRIAPDSASDAVAQALAIEQDPIAAAALLTAASRWPSDAIRAPVLRWLQNGSGTRPVAAEAALAIHRASKWTPGDLELIAAAMRRVPLSDLTPAGCRLLATIGTLDDRRRLEELLAGGSPSQRTTAADVLVGWPEHLDAILAVAKRDPSLIPAAARGVASHRATLDGFRAVAGLPAPEENVRRAALRTVGEVLATGDLLWAADEVGDDNATILWLLERALARAQRAVGAGQEGALELLREAAERLARRRLDLGRPAEAIAALDAVADASPTSRLASLRTVSLIVLGRLADARALGSGPDAWLEGLERSIELDHAGEVVLAIREDLGDKLTPEQAERFQELRAKIDPQAAALEPPTEPAPGGPG